MHGKDQKKVFIVGDFMIRNITSTGISRENTIKIRPIPGATTIDICNYIKPELFQNLMQLSYIVEQMIFQMRSILLRKLRSWSKRWRRTIMKIFRKF